MDTLFQQTSSLGSPKLVDAMAALAVALFEQMQASGHTFRATGPSNVGSLLFKNDYMRLYSTDKRFTFALEYTDLGCTTHWFEFDSAGCVR